VAGHRRRGGVRGGRRAWEVVVGCGGRARPRLSRGSRRRLVLALAGQRRRRTGAHRDHRPHSAAAA
jgi:hypothetical protein